MPSSRRQCSTETSEASSAVSSSSLPASGSSRKEVWHSAGRSAPADSWERADASCSWMSCTDSSAPQLTPALSAELPCPLSRGSDACNERAEVGNTAEEEFDDEEEEEEEKEEEAVEAKKREETESALGRGDLAEFGEGKEGSGSGS